MLNVYAIAKAKHLYHSPCYYADMDISENRVKSLLALQDKAGSQKQLAISLDCTPGYIGQLTSGYRPITEKNARKIEKKLNLPANWMDNNHLSGSSSHDNVSPITKKDGTPAIVGTVPLVSWVKAGEWAEIVDNYNVGDAEEMMLCPVNHSPNTFALRVEGDSMTNPMAGHRSYPHGTIIYIDPACQAELGDRVVAKLSDDNKATFKVLAEDAGQRFLKPLNPQYRNLEINGNCRIVGKVIGAFTPE